MQMLESELPLLPDGGLNLGVNASRFGEEGLELSVESPEGPGVD